MSSEQRPIHSPLGASSAERWMACPGSVSLIKELKIEEETDEPEYRTLGTAAHEAAAHCLKNNMDAWEVIGEKFDKHEVDLNMANAIQIFIDLARPLINRDSAINYIEHGLSYKQIEGTVTEIIDPRADRILKKYFYGTGDLCIVRPADAYMDVIDYKHGEGIVVDVENNPQLMYYAFGFILLHPEIRTVRLRIVQPRCAWSDPVKTWITTSEYIQNWVADQLVPAMQATELEGTELDAGSWCRFCPAKLVCPMMASLFGAAVKTNPKTVVALTGASLGRSWQYREAVKFYLKAMEDEIFRRLNLGMIVEGCKLVPKKANRVFKDGAAALFKEKFGDLAMHPPELRSPAEMEKIGMEAKELVREYAYTPQSGLTVAGDDDKRIAVKVETSTQAFAGAIKNLTGETQ